VRTGDTSVALCGIEKAALNLSAVFFIFLRPSSSGSWRGQDESTLQGAERRTLRTTSQCRLRVDTVEKGILMGSLSNIDSRRASNDKNPFARIRLFQILIPQLHFGDFFNTIGQFRTHAPQQKKVKTQNTNTSLGAACLIWVKTGKAQNEHKFSGLPPSNGHSSARLARRFSADFVAKVTAETLL
jgi:hypothetical protein